MSGNLVVLAPHPDDEILAAGGIMARALSLGHRVGVIVLTDGGRSNPATCPASLRATRTEEFRFGLAAMLGEVPPILMLAYPDGEFDSRRPDLTADSMLANFMRAIEPAAVFVTDPSDDHADHKAAFGLACRIVTEGLAHRLLVMPVSQRIDRPFSGNGFNKFPVANFAAAKRAAIQCHRSQLAAEPSGFALTEEVCEAFVALEYARSVYDKDAETRLPQAVAAQHFDEIYARSDDPWEYRTSSYEQDRFTRTIRALDDRRYNRALELGCAIGALTRKLAAHCDTILALDTSLAALNIARTSLSGLGNVELMQGNLPDDLPEGGFDLIVLSDFLYYLGFAGCVALARALAIHAAAGCRIIIVNYLGETDCALTGEMAAELMIAHLPEWQVAHHERTERLRIDVLDCA